MSVLTVIPCLNEAAHIEALLEQLLRDPTHATIVVADGGSTDGSRDIVKALAERHPRVHLLDNPDRIQSAGVNRAVAAFGAGHDWLLRVDAHCTYPDDYARMLIEAAETHEADAVVVPMITHGDTGFQAAVATASNSALGTGGSPHRHLVEGRFVEHGHHALMRLSHFTRAGGYCEAMACNEDAELDHRMAELGARLWLEPGAAIGYLPRATPAKLWKQYFKYGAGRARNLLRHRMRPRLRQLVPLAVPASLLSLPLALLHPIFALPFFAWLGLVLGLGALIGLRAGGGLRLLAGVAAAIMHLSWGLGFIWEVLRHPRGVAQRTPLSA